MDDLPLRGGVASGFNNVKGGTPLGFPATLARVALPCPLHLQLKENKEKNISQFFLHLSLATSSWRRHEVDGRGGGHLLVRAVDRHGSDGTRCVLVRVKGI